MTLRQVIEAIETAAANQPAVKTIVQNDVFRIGEKAEAQYGAFAWTQGTHDGTTYGALANYSFTLFYVDRLKADKSNMVEIQGTGCAVLQNIVRQLADEGIESEEYTVQTFCQRFSDECAGAFAQVTLTAPDERVCAEIYQSGGSAVHTLQGAVSAIEFAAAKQPAVKTVVENDVFRISECPSMKYGAFAWTQGAHTGRTRSGLATYQFTLFYVDRLTADRSNQIEVQSTACEVLRNVIRTLSERGMDSETFTIQPFNQRFADDCAGAYATVSFSVAEDYACAETYLDASATYLVTSDGKYIVTSDGKYIIVL